MRHLSLCLGIAVLVCLLFVSIDKSYSQCLCWANGIEAEFIPGSRGTVCEEGENGTIVISLSNPADFCDNEAVFGANGGECFESSGPVNPNPPPGMSCGPGSGSAGFDPEGICEQEIEDFCEELAARTIPTLSEWGLMVMAALLGFVGFMVVRRRRVTN